MGRLLERMFGPVGFAASMPPAPGRSLAVIPGAAAAGYVPIDGSGNTLGPFLLPDYGSWWLNRGTAWRIPACSQGIQVIAGTISTLPLSRWRDRVQLPDDTLMIQPDPAVARSATLFQTVEDLILFPYAYWVVLDRSLSDGRPSAVRYVPADQVVDELDDAGKRYLTYAGVDYPYRDVIRFPAPTPGLLVTGREALRTAYLLELAAQRNAEDPVPTGYIKNTGPVDLDDEEIDDLLDVWTSARRRRATAFLNTNTEYAISAFNAEEMQLVAAREQAASEIARQMNLPPRYVNAPMAGGTSLTYTTVESSRRDLVDLSLSVYIQPIIDRLSMDDITPRGQQVKFTLTEFYRSDLAGLVNTGVAGVNAGLFTKEEWRRMAGLPDSPSIGEYTPAAPSSSPAPPAG